MDAGHKNDAPLRLKSFHSQSESRRLRKPTVADCTPRALSTMSPSKTELRSRGKAKTDVQESTKADEKKETEVTGPMDAQGNLLDTAYYFKQYVGLFLSMIAFACVCFAGYAPKYGYSVNLFLYSSRCCVTWFSGPVVSFASSHQSARAPVVPSQFATKSRKLPTPKSFVF